MIKSSSVVLYWNHHKYYRVTFAKEIIDDAIVKFSKMAYNISFERYFNTVFSNGMTRQLFFLRSEQKFISIFSLKTCYVY